MSLIKKEFNVRGGSSPFVRFVLGFILMVGALMFLGCPLRMILRLGGGDLNAVTGLVGFTVGIGIGIIFLNKGFSLKRSYKLSKFEGFVFPAVNIVLLALLVSAPAVIFFSKKGPGAAFCHNFSLASSAKGPTANGMTAVIIGFVVVAVVSYFNMERTASVKMKGEFKNETV